MRLEFELASFKAAVQYLSHYATEIPRKFFLLYDINKITRKITIHGFVEVNNKSYNDIHHLYIKKFKFLLNIKEVS